MSFAGVARRTRFAPTWVDGQLAGITKQSFLRQQRTNVGIIRPAEMLGIFILPSRCTGALPAFAKIAEANLCACSAFLRHDRKVEQGWQVVERTRPTAAEDRVDRCL